MKYGDTLQQRSIPLWETYNVDYNDIKRLIKIHTTKGQARATVIPGKQNEAIAIQKFEDELYVELYEQHQRIDLFVRSKSGEIARRLAHLDKQISHLRKRSGVSNQVRIPVRRLEKFSKLEEDTLKAGEEIQSLSRFVGAQRLAFQKLLKKYRKWTGSSQLGRRFQKEVLGRPSSFSSRDFEPLLTQWTEVLTAVRAPFSARIPRDAAQSGRKRSASQNSGQSKVSQLPKTSANAQNEINRGTEEVLSSVGDLHFTCERGSNVDIDAALAVLPLGPHAGRASYWVHPDHLVEIHILLLQYTRIRKSISSRNSTSSPSSHRPSRAGSIDGHGTMLGGKPEDDVGVIVCDDLQRFAKRQSAATIDSESMLGSVAERAAASIRYVSTGEAMVVAGTGDFSRLPSDVGDRKMPRIAKFKRKALNDLFDSSTELSLAQSRPSSSSISAESTETNNAHKFSAVRTWLANHLEVQPLVQIQSKRTRFVGLRNSESSGVWATLDIDILMRKCSVNISDCNEAFSTFSNEGGFDLSKFPHALLEVRFEGKGASKLIVALDESHLTERIRGFSLETHAVATLCNPKGMPRPFWFPALEHDIRKIPSQAKSSRRRSSSSQVSPPSASTGRTSVSATSTSERPTSSGFSAPLGSSSATSAPDLLESPSFSIFKKKRKSRSRREHPLRKEISEASSANHQRYWNEFDDGDEGSEDEAYTIFVDPNASSLFPGSATIAKIFHNLVAGTKASTKKVRSWLNATAKHRTPERQHLIEEEDFISQASAEDNTDLNDNDSSPTHLPRHRRQYSTISTGPSQHALKMRETLLFRACIASFTASFTLLIIASILAGTGRKKAVMTVDLGVAVGVIASLVFAVVAVGTMIARTDRLGWMHRVTVVLLFALDCIGCAMLGLVLGSV